MGDPTPEFGYTSATTGRGDYEVYMDLRWHWKKKKTLFLNIHNISTGFVVAVISL
jgi:hypothetical protein